MEVVSIKAVCIKVNKHHTENAKGSCAVPSHAATGVTSRKSQAWREWGNYLGQWLGASDELFSNSLQLEEIFKCTYSMFDCPIAFETVGPLEAPTLALHKAVNVYEAESILQRQALPSAHF